MSTVGTGIVDRIKKLMQLADDASNANEAALAASRMQQLLTQHNLTRSEVEGTQASSPVHVRREKTQYDGRTAKFKYSVELMETIALNNFCMHFVWDVYTPDSKGSRYRWINEIRTQCRRVKTHVLIGRHENVQASILMFENLIQTMQRLCPYPRLCGAAVLWMSGCTESICERLTQQRRKEEKAHTGPGLMVMYGTEEDLNRDIYRGVEPGTTARERREEEAQKAAIEKTIKELVASGTDQDDAWYIANGYPVPARDPGQIDVKRRRSSYVPRGPRYAYAAEAREHERRSSVAFTSGKAKGRDIGLGGRLKPGSKSLNA